MAADSSTDAGSGSRFDYQQVSFVVLAALAIVLAAFFVPGFAGGDGGGSSEIAPDTDADADADGDPPEISFDWTELLEWLDLDRDGGERIDPDVDGGAEVCTIALDREPVPGSDVTATIHYGGEPLTDVPVWFNERSVGETDERGQVTGEVPYVEELVVRVGAEEEPNCEAVGPAAAGPVTAGPTAIAAASDEANGTVQYEVEGDVEITVLDDPYPGDAVELVAEIEDAPMREATVAVDGEAVTETATDGSATITVPDDGSDRVDVRVERGDFAGTATVDVLLLEATLAPGGLAPVPGSDGYVVAETAGEPVPDAVVSIDGEHVGTTDDEGQLAVELPRDPTTTVTVSTADQTATTTLAGAYGGLALVLSLLVGGAAAVASRTHGARGSIAVVGLATGLALVLVVEALYGPVAGLVALVGVAAIGAAAALGRRGAPDVDPPAVRDGTRGVARWLVGRVLAVVALLETLVDRLRAGAAAAREWLGSLPRSVTELAAGFLAWLRSLPGRVIAAIGRVADRGRNLSTATRLAIGGAVPLLAGAYVVDGTRGLVVGGAILAVVVTVLLRSDGRDEATDPAASIDAGAGAAAVGAAGGEGAEPSIRELWRAFARQVAPGRWRTSTPGEIERAAREAGYPREPVRELTTLFREVEYGDRPLSERVRERADRAYGELARDAPTTDGGRTGGRSEDGGPPENASPAARRDDRRSDDRSAGDRP